MSDAQFHLWSHVVGPNGWKVAIVLEALGLSYETTFVDFQKQEQKSEEHTKLNPNGRIPTLTDRKNNFSLWESNAIIQYLVDKYDTEHKLSADEAHKYEQLQWLYFQSSGQGPYFGQAAWFTWFHSEKHPDAIERYKKEIVRVTGVIEKALERNGTGWLVGDKMTIADLSFVPWNALAFGGLVNDYADADLSKFPKFAAWHKALTEYPPVAKCLAQREEMQKKK